MRKDVVKLDEPLWFGIHKGKKPVDMLQQPREIEYLLWLRDAKHEKKEMPDGTVSKVAQYNTPMSKDLLMVLDHVIRSSLFIGRDYTPVFSESDFDVWRAEKRLEKARIAKEKEIEDREIQEIKRLEKERIEQARILAAMKKRQEQMKTEKEQAQRNEKYDDCWGAW